MVPNYLEYRKSISNELISIKNRVRHFIDNRQHAEEGRYKEIILANVLRSMLPEHVSVGTGFVIGDQNNLSSQIDIIIYKKDYPVLFKIADFVIVPAEGVLGIIEVKTCLGRNNTVSAIEKSHSNGLLFRHPVFNGIFGFETNFIFNDIRSLPQSIGNALRNNHGRLNYACFGKDYLMVHWPRRNDRVAERYCFYHLHDLSFGYFVSNLIEDITGVILDNGVLRSFLYPISQGKEAYRLEHLEVEV
ncbi:MAG: DUF6602 domain-containing protein [Bacillota bacterium]|jgi:hypothetical protein